MRGSIKGKQVSPKPCAPSASLSPNMEIHQQDNSQGSHSIFLSLLFSRISVFSAKKMWHRISAPKSNINNGGNILKQADHELLFYLLGKPAGFKPALAGWHFTSSLPWGSWGATAVNWFWRDLKGRQLACAIRPGNKPINTKHFFKLLFTALRYICIPETWRNAAVVCFGLGAFFLNKVIGKQISSVLALLRPPFLGQIIFEVTFLCEAKSSVPPVPQSDAQAPLDTGLHMSRSFGMKHTAKQEAGSALQGAALVFSNPAEPLQNY